MRSILLDEAVPERLGPLPTCHLWSSVQREGWAGLKNGKLPAAAAGRFDVLLTADKRVEFQQDPTVLSMAVMILRAPSNRMDDLAKVVPAALSALQTLQPKTLVSVSA